MIHVLELDLADPGDRLPLVEGQAWILLRAGDEVVGEAWENGVTPATLDVLHVALLQRHREEVVTRALLRPRPSDGALDPSTVTVVVSCRGNPELLDGCVGSILALDPAPGEVVLADDTGYPKDDEGDGSVAAVASRHGLDLVVAPAGGPLARDTAWRRARGEVVAFLDDADRCHARFVAALSAAFAAPGIAAATGLVVAAELGTSPQVWFERAGGMRAGFRRHLLGGDGSTDDLLLPRWSAASLAVRRHVLEALDGFDPALDAGVASHGGDDLDLVHRVLDAGHAVLHEPSAIIRRVHPRARSGLLAGTRANARAHAAYQVKRAALSPATARAVRRSRHRDTRHRLVLGLRAVLKRKLLELQVVLAEAAGQRAAMRTRSSGCSAGREHALLRTGA
ncbi:MAG: glycosyltransferase family 2 protein [Acidimicrobiia bacterium]